MGDNDATMGDSNVTTAWPSQVFGGAALREAGALLTVGGASNAGGNDGSGSSSGGDCGCTYAVGGAVSAELSRRFAEAEVADGVRGGGGGKRASADDYVQRYYPGRTFVTSDDVAASVLQRGEVAAPLCDTLRATAGVAMRVALKRGYVLAGITELERLSDDPLVDPELLADAVADLAALASTTGKPRTESKSSANTKHRKTPKSNRGARGGDVSGAGAAAKAKQMTPITLPSDDGDDGDDLIELEGALAPPPELAAMIRRAPADASDPEAVRRLEARMAYHLAALEEWATMIARYVESVRRELEER